MLAVDKKETFGEDFERKAHAYYTHVLVSGTKMVKPYAEAFNLSEDKVYPIGRPRTDIFFDQEKIEKKKEQIYSLYPQIKNKKVILYTPTFRGDYKRRRKFRNELDFNSMQRLQEKGYVLLYKTHPNVIEPVTFPDRLKDFVFDVSPYPEINDLFFVTDILITDYSTTIFEFALLNKPIIAYAYDIDSYLDERGFYYDYDFIIPGPIFKSTDDIVEYISNLKSLYVDHSKFIEFFMDRIDGNSTKRVLELI
jgi:CDP-glycerol glycerophosphotransferase (TagB/SpsB family)